MPVTWRYVMAVAWAVPARRVAKEGRFAQGRESLPSAASSTPLALSRNAEMGDKDTPLSARVVDSSFASGRPFSAPRSASISTDVNNLSARGVAKVREIRGKATGLFGKVLRRGRHDTGKSAPPEGADSRRRTSAVLADTVLRMCVCVHVCVCRR